MVAGCRYGLSSGTGRGCRDLGVRFTWSSKASGHAAAMNVTAACACGAAPTSTCNGVAPRSSRTRAVAGEAARNARSSGTHSACAPREKQQIRQLRTDPSTLKDQTEQRHALRLRQNLFTLVTGPRRSLSLKLSDTRVYAPQIRARLGTTAHFCEVVVLKLKLTVEHHHRQLLALTKLYNPSEGRSRGAAALRLRPKITT